MNIEKHLSGLLAEQDCVIVPGFGGFITNYIPAGINPVTHVFTPPSRQVAFNARLRNNDGILANHLVRSLDITYAEAVAAIEKLSVEWVNILNKSEKVIIQGIGLIFSDKENNLQFIPESNINLLDDAFGLTSFSSLPIQKLGTLQKSSEKRIRTNAVSSARKLPSSLKWAVVLLPLAALSFWSAFNTNKVTNLYHNVASVIPSPAESSSTKTATPFAVNIPAAENNAEVIVPETVKEAEVIATPEAVKVENNYFIIAGAFGVKENADKLVESLKAKGYDASIAGQNRNGLFRVSIEGFSEMEIALQKTEEMRKGDFPGAWLLTLR
jgi:cell division septation protein DedD/nucleoid DNA-binding protein